MKETVKEFHTKRSGGIKFSLLILCLFSTWIGYAVDVPNVNSEYVTLFKNAISSPPEIEQFVAKRTQLLLPAGQKKDSSQDSSFKYFEGAISGKNFYLHHIPDPDLPTNINHPVKISARSGSSNYEIAGQGLIKRIGGDGFKGVVDSSFRLARQIIGMGVGEIEPNTVKWNGNNFTATNIMGKGVHGSLQISNDLPFRMEVSLDGRPLPYQAIEYTYPTPLDAFAGYPARFLILYTSNDGLAPLAEVEFKSLKLATQHLDASFFNEARFTNVLTYTNLVSNSDIYVFTTHKDGSTCIQGAKLFHADRRFKCVCPARPARTTPSL